MLYMGIHKLPVCRMYWETFTNVPMISETMTHFRFDEILFILDFNDINPALSTGQDRSRGWKLPIEKKIREPVRGTINNLQKKLV